jgi:uncharacterized Zn-finger protein
MGSSVKCPYCREAAVEITLLDEQGKRFLCTGPHQHEFTNEIEAEDTDQQYSEPLIVL